MNNLKLFDSFWEKFDCILYPSLTTIIVRKIFWIWIGLMLTVVSRLFFYENIGRLLLRNLVDNLHKYKANFLWWFPTNLRVFIFCEANYSYQFCYLIKKNALMIFSVKRELIPTKYREKEPDNICYIFFINTVYFLTFVNKYLFKVTNLFIYFSIYVYF